jgi:thiosulfate/3-mercaptopyruvate sulfurtransferase
MTMINNYTHPETLVSTDWVAGHATDPKVRRVEVDVDFSLYEKGHIAGAVGWSWETDLCDRVRRDICDRPTFERLCSRAGIANDSTVVFYGDANNWFAAWAFWQFKLYGHGDVRLMNGGRKKWEMEGRPYTTEIASVTPTQYRAAEPDVSIRAFQSYVAERSRAGDINLVDVRSPDEFTGKVIAPPGLNETAQRGGHIPGAKNVPWSQAVNEDGTFKPLEQLRALYEGAGVSPSRDTVAYCRIGERSSHTWYVLKYLLGYPNVRNYDGSWTEWGNLVGAPIER